MLQTIWLALLSTFGSSAADGALRRLRTKQGVWREWNLARSRFGWRANVGDIRRFLETVFETTGWDTDASDDAINIGHDVTCSRCQLTGMAVSATLTQ